jgi:hypothetical protein
MLQVIGELFPDPSPPPTEGGYTPAYTEAEQQQAAQRGFSEAIRRCGDWPITGTLRDFEASIIRAEHEAERALDLWARWSRHARPVPEGKRLELGSIRLNARHQIAKHVAQVRQARFELIVNHQGHA